MAAVLSVIVGFLLSGLIGNWLVQKWQARNWLHQQRFLGQEKEYLALKELADEIATLMGARLYHMQRVAFTLTDPGNQRLIARLGKYEAAVVKWNERLTSFYVRLALLSSSELTYTLERTIHTRFQQIGQRIDKLIQVKQGGNSISSGAISEVVKELTKIQVNALSFNKAVLRIVEKRKTDVYFGVRLRFSWANMGKFSTWQLVKALFVRDVNSLSILSTTVDF
jgi:hypothetical protein